MRALIIVAGFSLGLAACGDKSATDADANVSANLASEAIFANDTTVIDAATGDAVNMAADVAYTENSLEGDGDVTAEGSSTERPARRREAASQRQDSDSNEAPAPAETSTETNSL